MSGRERVSVIVATILMVMLGTIISTAIGLAESSSNELSSAALKNESKPGYPNSIPPDTKPDTVQGSVIILKNIKGEIPGIKGCHTYWDWGYWSEPQRAGNDVVGYAYTYASTTCWQNPITRVKAKAILWKWEFDDQEWYEVARDREYLNFAGQADAYPTYEKAESGYYIQTSYHYAQQGVWPILEETEESDYVWLDF